MFLSHGFGHVGSLVGKRPVLIFISSTLLFIASLVLLFVKPPTLNLSFDNGYTSIDAPSIRELTAQKAFFYDKGEPWYLALFAEPRNTTTGSMTNSKEFEEFRTLYKTRENSNSETYTRHCAQHKSLKEDIIIRVDDSGEDVRNLTYMDYCGATCGFNDVVFKAWDLSFFGIQWPVANLFGYKANIGKHFFEREMKGDELKKANMTALYFMVLINSTSMADDMEEFEKLLLERITEFNQDETKLIKLTQHGARGIKKEIARGSVLLAYKLVAGFILLLVITFASLCAMNNVNARCNVRVVLLAPLAALLPFMAFCTSSALLASLCGMHFNTPMLVSPVLFCAIGLDGILILYQTWLRETGRFRDGESDYMTEVMASCMPSIAMQVVAVSGALILGRFIPMPEMANFCFFCGITVLFVFFYQIFLFAPCLIWLAPIQRHQQLNPDGTCSQALKCSEWWHSLLEWYANNVSRCFCFRMFVVGAALAFFFIPSFIGITKVEANLDYRQLLPKDTNASQGVHFMSDIVWPQFLHIVYFIENPPNFEDPHQYHQFLNFVDEAEARPKTMSREANMIFLKDFRSFSGIPEDAPFLNMTNFKNFITDDIYKNWNSGVQYTFDEKGHPTINKMVLMVAYEGIQSLADKAKVMTDCRNVAARYPQFEAYPFDTEVNMVDVILQTPTLTYLLPTMIFFLSFTLFAVFASNFAIALAFLFSSVCIYSGTVFISSLFGMTLNPLAVSFLVFIAAMTLRASVHICYFFQQVLKMKGDVMDRMNNTLEAAMLPSILSTLCGACLFLPVLTSQTSVFFYMALLNFIHFIISFLFALLFLPILLSLLPQRLTGSGCIYTNV